MLLGSARTDGVCSIQWPPPYALPMPEIGHITRGPFISVSNRVVFSLLMLFFDRGIYYLNSVKHIYTPVLSIQGSVKLLIQLFN